MIPAIATYYRELPRLLREDQASRYVVIHGTDVLGTWDTYRDAAKKQKAKGHPFGQTLGHTFGDAPGFTYPYLWSWGGKEVEADGKTVVINSKETIESVKFMTALWKEGMDEGGLAWDGAGREWTVLYDGAGPQGEAAAAALGAKVVAQASPSLDEIFVARAGAVSGGASHAERED